MREFWVIKGVDNDTYVELVYETNNETVTDIKTLSDWKSELPRNSKLFDWTIIN